MHSKRTYTAFAGTRCIASGSIEAALLQMKEALAHGEQEPLLVFDDQTGTQLDFDLRGTPEEALARLAEHPCFAPAAVEASRPRRTGPGRPKLGVVCREVSLLPRHWEWLGRQPGGASATLRRLVDEARKQGEGAERARAAREAVSRVLTVLVGDLPGYEEASRALFAKDQERFEAQVRLWPEDVRAYLLRLVGEVARLEGEAAGDPGASMD
jgi:hypothetical protein